MKAGGVIFQHLLDGKLQYRVPLFQRTYSWGEDEWDRLWNDVLEIYAMEKPRNHFIGAVVTQLVTDAAGHAIKYLLIDGQQRLTTLFIMLASVRQRASQVSELSTLAEEIWETCLVNKFAPASDDFLKLRPTQRDRRHFFAVINGDEIDGNGQIIAASRFFSRKLAEGDLQEMALDLRELKKCITERLDLVSITLESDDSPHRIFESLNNTGMQLGASDLIRNLIFMNISGEAETQDAYDRHWYPMQEATSTDLDDFFWRYLMMDGSLPRWNETFEEIKNHCRVGDNSRTIQTLLQFAKFAKYYRQLREMGGEQTEAGLLREIRRLNTWEASVAYPFLMRSLDWVNDRLISSDDLAHVVRMIESFVVRRTVCNVPTNRLRGIFAQMSMQVGSEDFVASSRNYLLGDHWPTDEEFKVAFVSFNAYARRLARTRLILESLEESFGHPEIPKMTEKITIEHLMPQTLTSEWETMLGPQAKEIHSRWLHTPGNLTLTGFNSELGNASFSEKKVLLEESKFSLTDSVLRCNQWDESKIRDRGETLADRAIQIWRR